jgi:hypothetical protein
MYSDGAGQGLHRQQQDESAYPAACSLLKSFDSLWNQVISGADEQNVDLICDVTILLLFLRLPDFCFSGCLTFVAVSQAA